MPELITIDTSVIIAALRKQEKHYLACRAILEQVNDRLYIAIEPYTVLVEIVAAIKRRTNSQKLSERVIKDILSIDTIHFLDLDTTRAVRAVEIAQRFGVRGMDAIVIQMTEEFGATLVSLDMEMLEKVKTLVKIKELRSL